MSEKTHLIRSRITYSFVNSEEDFERFIDWLAESFYKKDHFALANKLTKIEYLENIYHVTHNNFKLAMEKGLAICLKVDGDPALYVIGYDVIDLHPKLVGKENPVEFLDERIFYSTLNLISNCERKGTSFFFDSVVKNPYTNYKDSKFVFEGLRISIQIINSRGYTDFYITTLTKNGRDFMLKLKHEIIATIYQKNLQFDRIKLFIDAQVNLHLCRLNNEYILSLSNDPFIENDSKMIKPLPKL